ncbi:MAG TPA: ribonuclease T2 [Rubellimicrobium sp.]|jgi:ribonuclease T2|nr:ribonuclease T2 [Rubellimicrobium sp.]
MRATLWALALLATPVAAEEAGEFDYYVLSLSWSPNWCALEGAARGAPECEEGEGLGWILHGLWPQYEDGGWPSRCETRVPDATRRQTAAMADIMGSDGLAWHEWQVHGTCSGLSAGEYFNLAREAFEAVAIPDVFERLPREVALPASLVEEAFLRADPELWGDAITVTCEEDHIQEVRLCLTRGLELRACGVDAARDCTLDDALMEPVP